MNRFAAPTTPTETRLAEIWAERLGLDRVGIDDDLLELGADSLSGMVVCETVENDYGYSVGLSALMSMPTIRQFAQAVDQHTLASVNPAMTAERLKNHHESTTK